MTGPAWRRRGLLAASLADVLFLYLPIAVLIVYSFNAAKLAMTWQGFSLQWYAALARDHALMAACRNSILIAVASTSVATLLGVSAAIGLERLPRRLRTWLGGAFLLPLVMPEIMMGVSLLLFFVLVKVPLGLLTVTIGHAVFNLPVVLLIVRSRLRKLDPQLEEAARDLGATPWQAFRLVTLPLLRPAIIGAALLAFTVSLDDFVVTFFTAGPGATTLPLKVYSMIRTGISPEINALSAILVVVSMTLVGLSLAVQQRGTTQS
jgi:spermidine/putrescine transport system permease protein